MASAPLSATPRCRRGRAPRDSARGNGQLPGRCRRVSNSLKVRYRTSVANDEHDLALLLADSLVDAGLEAHPTGKGCHWQVNVGAASGRSVLVHCFWYSQFVSGLALGMNPGNARRALHESRSPLVGAQYLVILREHDKRVAEGRARAIEEVVTAAGTWLSGKASDEVERAAPFIGADRRAVLPLVDRLDGRLRWEIFGDPSHDLWVYGDGRSCRVRNSEKGLTCGFLLGHAQVAFGIPDRDIVEAIAMWLVDRARVAGLGTLAGVELERHVEHIEDNPARWHWLHVRDRIADPHDVLSALKPVIELLAESPIASRFYSFSSLNCFCFSASSHYPWINEGLPSLVPNRDGTYQVNGFSCEKTKALQLVEQGLASSPLRPFFGGQPQYDFLVLTGLLERVGSALRPRVVQEAEWPRLQVTNESNSRRCVVSGGYVRFCSGDFELWVLWPSIEESVDTICRFFADASLEDLAADAGRQRLKHGIGPARRGE